MAITLQRVGQRVLKAADRDDMTLILSPEIGANAIVPSEFDADTIYVGSDMVLLAANDDQLACLIGHELAHVEAGHTDADARMDWWRELTRKSLAYADPIGLLVWGEDSPPAEAATIVLADVPRRLSGWGLQDEREADARSLDYTHQAGFDANACAELALQLLRLETATGEVDDEQWLRTHPGTSERVLRLREGARSLRDGDPKG